MAAHRQTLPGARWHFQHGPMDIVIGADGEHAALVAAHEAAWQRFQTLLDELVAELPKLRSAVSSSANPMSGVVARRMWAACWPHSQHFITPMAAVAGAVADELIVCYQRAGIRRAWVNNGGDIALHLLPQQSFNVGLYADLARFGVEQKRDGITLDGCFTVNAASPVRGIATSGWRGRSFSLGIADSVTVLARTAAEADAAATMIANAVNVDDEHIVRRPANQIKDNSDLGNIPVTVFVPTLSNAKVAHALQAGTRRALELRANGMIWSAALTCQGMLATTDAEALA